MPPGALCCCDLGRLLARPAAQLFLSIGLHHFSEDFCDLLLFGGAHSAGFFVCVCVRKSAWKVKFCETLPSENIFVVL